MNNTDRAIGCLVGLAAGDKNGGPTQMMMQLCDSLIANQGRVNVDDIGKRYLNWYNNDGYDTGFVTAKTFDYVNKGMTFKSASEKVDFELHNMTGGVSPAHRSAPLGVLLAKKTQWLWTAPQPLEPEKSIRFQLGIGAADIVNGEAKLTHYNPIAREISKATNIIIMCLILGLDFEDAVRHSLDSIAWSNVRDDLTNKELVRSELINSGYSPSVLIAAVWFIRNTNSFEEALTESIKFAGITNYCPVLVGSIGGAMYGIDAIPSSCTEHLQESFDSISSIKDVVTVKARELTYLQLPVPSASSYIDAATYPSRSPFPKHDFIELMSNIKNLIDFTKDSDMCLIVAKSEDMARKYKKDFEKMWPGEQRRILPKFDIRGNNLTMRESFQLIKKDFNVPDYSKLNLKDDITAGVSANDSYHSICYMWSKYLKYLDANDIVHLIIGLIEAENQKLYMTGSTNQIYHMFDTLRLRNYRDVDALEEWAWHYADNCYVPTGSCGNIRAMSGSVAEYHENWDKYAQKQAQQKLDRLERLKRIKKENAAKQVEMRERQAKNSKKRGDLINKIKLLDYDGILVTISSSEKPPYYFPIELVESMADEKIKKIPADIGQQIISRIHSFNFDRLHRRTTKMMRPWYEFSHRLKRLKITK